MEVWQIVLICALLIPAFLLANYVIVTRMVGNQRRKDDQIDRAVAAMAGRSKGADKYKPRPRYGSRRRSL